MMNNESGHIGVSLDQLIALCDEMRALVRTGVPLERGLLAVADDLPGKQAELAAEIGRRGNAGEAMDQILEGKEIELPELFRCVVLAGIRSGRLSVALEGLAMTARQIAELRRSIIQAMIYPMVVLCLVCLLALAVFTRLSDVYQEARYVHRVHGSEWLVRALAWLGEWMWVLAPVSVLAFLAWSFLTARASAMQPRRSNSWFSWLPWTRRLLRHGRRASFLEVLALLIENDVSLQEALTLAARASGDDGLVRDANELAAQIESGRPLDSAKDASAIPPLVRWQLAAHPTKQRLVESLKAVSRSERRQADYLAEWLRIQLPVIFTVGIGGSVTLVYALAVLLPWYSMLSEIADPILMQR